MRLALSIGAPDLLTDAKARKTRPGDKPVSDSAVRGLYLFSSAATGSGKWILRFFSPETGKRRDMGLGNYPSVSIKEARVAAFQARKAIESGEDPIEQRNRRMASVANAAAIPSFADAARNVHADLADGFRNKKHIDQWINTLELYVIPMIGTKPVNELRAGDFAACLRPIWLKKPETASRVKQRCDAVMTWCAALGQIVASPVGVVDRLLPKQPGKRERVEHQPALPWRKLPEFFRGVLHHGSTTMSKEMLEVLILTAARSGEVRQMTWGEVDLVENIWTVPAIRMKAKVSHRVPLSPRVVALLGKRISDGRDHSSLVFPSRKNTPISDMTLTKFLRDHNIPSDTPERCATAHGFRSSFRDWASEHGYPRDVAERALAHTVKNTTEAAYHRTDLLDQRREMMLAWESFALGLG